MKAATTTAVMSISCAFYITVDIHVHTEKKILHKFVVLLASEKNLISGLHLWAFVI